MNLRPPLPGGACPAALLVLALALLSGCASRVPWGGERDGSGSNPPDGLAQLPDAVPRVDALHSGGPNKPYVVFGRRYEPMTVDAPLREHGLASWYGRKFHRKPTSNGETYDMYAMTAAHKTMPLPSYARVRNERNGREVIVRVNDRGPFVEGRVIDLSYAAALRLGTLGGLTPVSVERLTHDEIRAGSWRRDAVEPSPPVLAAVDAEMPPDLSDPLMALVGASADAGLAVASTPAAGYWLQLGAFRERDGAAALQQRVRQRAGWLAEHLTLQDDGALVRLHAGPWASRDDALDAAERLQAAMALTPLLLDRR